MPGFKSLVRVAVIDPDGTVVHEQQSTNFLTETGEAYIADQCSDRGATRMTHMAIGIGSGQTRTDTALDDERQRVALTGTYATQGTGANDNDFIYTATFPASSDYQVSEAAVFNDAVTGTMFNYVTFSPAITKSASQSLELTITVTCGFS